MSTDLDYFSLGKSKENELSKEFQMILVRLGYIYYVYITYTYMGSIIIWLGQGHLHKGRVRQDF